MVFGLFGEKKGAPPGRKGDSLTAQLNVRLQPIQRGYFEDPLDEMLTRLGVGEVSGGGTQTADEPAGIAYCDIELSVIDRSEATISAIIAELERLGAPKGSKLIFDRMPDAIVRANEQGLKIVAMDESGAVPFGQFEGMALFLNGTDLPTEVYRNNDINKVIRALEEALGDQSSYWGHWEGSRETGLYFYGQSFAGMKAAIEPVLASNPLCQRCRVEQIA